MMKLVDYKEVNNLSFSFKEGLYGKIITTEIFKINWKIRINVSLLFFRNGKIENVLQNTMTLTNRCAMTYSFKSITITVANYFYTSVC